MPGGRDDQRTTPERTPTAAPAPTVRPLNGGVPWIPVSWRRPGYRAIPNRWSSVTVTSASARGVLAGRGERPPSASGSGAVGRGWHGSGPWAGSGRGRPTDADGEGDVPGLPDQKTCTGPLDFPPLIDGFVSPDGPPGAGGFVRGRRPAPADHPSRPTTHGPLTTPERPPALGPAPHPAGRPPGRPTGTRLPHHHRLGSAERPDEPSPRDDERTPHAATSCPP